MRGNRDLKALQALLFGSAALVTVYFIDTYVRLINNQTVRILTRPIGMRELVYIGTLAVVIWALTGSTYKQWEWARRAVLVIASLALAWGAYSASRLLIWRVGFFKKDELDALGHTINPVVVGFAIELLYTILIVWAVLVIYFALSYPRASDT